MKKFYTLSQNNSGGGFTGPAITIVIEADNSDQATELVSKHITLCGDSGKYADYDDCGCCPCCGHRWSAYFGEPEESIKILPYLDFLDKNNWGKTGVALIKNDGTMIVCDTGEKIHEAHTYMIKPWKPNTD